MLIAKFRHSEDKKDLTKKVKKMRRELEDMEAILEDCIEEEEYDDEDYREDEMDDRDMRREMRRTRMRSSGGRYRRM